MSGGAFNYAYSHVGIFADDLGTRLDQRDKVDEWGYTPNKVGDETYARLREIEALARHVAKLMKDVEWMYSGDIGEDDLLRTMKSKP